MVTIPDGWTEIDATEPQQLRAFQRNRDGLVASLEEGVTQDKYCIAFLPENFQDDNQVIRRLGDNGYLYSGDSKSEALSELEEWMENNQR